MNSIEIAARKHSIVVRPRGNVSVGWRWKEIYDRVSMAVGELSESKQKDRGFDRIDLTILGKVVNALFAYATSVTRAVLVTCEVRHFDAHQSLGAYLRDLDPATDAFCLQICPHPHLTVGLRIVLEPAGSLLRSKRELLDSILGIQTLFPPQPTAEDKREVRAKERERLCAAKLREICAKVQNPLAADTALLALEAAASVQNAGRYSISRNTLAKLLCTVRPRQFPNRERVEEVLSTLTQSAYVEAQEHDRKYPRLKLLESGRKRVALLLD